MATYNKFKQTSEIKPLVSFVIDDGYTMDLTRLKPLFDSKGVVACTAVISNAIGTTGYLSLEQLMTLKNAGWEIASHSKSHPYLSELTEPQIVEELKGSFDALNELGLEVETMVIPNSQHNALVREVSKRYYNATFTRMGSLISVPINTHNLSRTLMGEDAPAPYNTLEYYKSRVDLALSNNSWLVFCLHSNQFEGDTQFNYLSQTIDYIQGLGIDIVTPKQGLEIYKNVLEIRNEYTGSYTAIAKNGSVYSDRLPFLAIKLPDSVPITADSPHLDFPDNQISYLKITSANASGFPENKAGILTTNKLVAEAGYIYQEYFVNGTRDVYRRYWRETPQIWSTWEKQIVGLPAITYTMPALTISANSLRTLNVGDPTITSTHTHIAQPAGVLESGILWNCWAHGNGALKLRLYNCTSEDINLEERVWKISRIRQ